MCCGETSAKTQLLLLMTGSEQFYMASVDRKFKTTGEVLVGFPLGVFSSVFTSEKIAFTDIPPCQFFPQVTTNSVTGRRSWWTDKPS